MQPGIIRQNGFIWLALAREGVLPLTLLEKTKESFFQRLIGAPGEAEAMNATVFSLFPKKGKGIVPKISPPGKVAFFKGFDLLDLKSEATVQAKQKIPLLGKSAASAKLATASRLLYSFGDVQHLSVETEVLLEEYLNTKTPVEEAYGFLKKLQKGHLFVVTEVLQTRHFTVKDASDLTFSGELSADAIEKIIALKAKTQTQSEKEKELSFKGETPVTFALKAYRIQYNKEEGYYSLSRKKLKIVKGDTGLEKDSVSDEETIELL
ncbi:hypothetical protein Q4E93_20295 [Flavitalea sp. BT771]|uniref:hypothetical protein n=1 Tax=Flavitalea sp. BT771 TaxID=3063329 RepID=UPI0026E3FA74|nr:hypothetical protein [Flavitalea sp. BT771]MDO6432960.1 hypothetical protein [Flavitalea sp. BT771]MDV6221764.1 hypothetical protein [Flavitalea sp. BT771]